MINLDESEEKLEQKVEDLRYQLETEQETLRAIGARGRTGLYPARG